MCCMKKFKENILFKNVLVLINIILFSIIYIIMTSYCFSNDKLLKIIIILFTSLMLTFIFKLVYKNDKKVLSLKLNIILLLNSILAAISFDTWFVIIIALIIDLVYLLFNINYKSINKKILILFNMIFFIVSLLSSFNFTNDFIRYGLLIIYSLILIIFVFKNKDKVSSKSFMFLNILLFLISIINCIVNINYVIGYIYILLNFILIILLIINFDEFKFKIFASMFLLSCMVLYTFNDISKVNLNNNLDFESNENLIQTYNNLIKDSNDYSLKKDYRYVHIVEKIDCNDWKNTLYTIADTGLYYDTSICANNLSENKSYISIVNSFVHPFNMLNKNEDNIGKRVYDADAVNDLTSYVDIEYDRLYDEKSTIEDNIRRFHDELISSKLLGKDWGHTKIFNQSRMYDSEFTSVIMKLFLDKLGLENIIMYGLNENNTWNIVKIDDKYVHLDIYYDNKLSSEDVISYRYFLIEDEIINSIDLSVDKNNTYHKYNKNVYKEFLK